MIIDCSWRSRDSSREGQGLLQVIQGLGDRGKHQGQLSPRKVTVTVLGPGGIPLPGIWASVEVLWGQFQLGPLPHLCFQGPFTGRLVAVVAGNAIQRQW